VNEEYRWYPIDKLAMFESMLSESIAYTKEQYALFLQAKDKPHVLDDSLINRGVKVFQDQLEETDYYDKQIARWRKEGLTDVQQARVAQFEVGTNEYRDGSKKALVLLEELGKGTINRIMEMDDAELAFNVLLGKTKPPSGQSFGRPDKYKNVTDEHIKTASDLDIKVRALERKGCDEIEILKKMYYEMPKFKILMDAVGQDGLDLLCARFAGFYRYTMIINNIAAGLASGEIKVP